MTLVQIVQHMIKSLAVACVVLMGANAYAQQLIFCESYSNKGEPKNAKDEWAIGKNGLDINILYNNGKTTIDVAKVIFLIEDKSNPLLTDEIVVPVNQQLNWVGVAHFFDRPGEFIITAHTPKKEALATKQVTIKTAEMKPIKVKEEIKSAPLENMTKKEVTEVKEEEKAAVTKINYSKEEVEKVHYYDNSRLLFGDKFEGENLANPRSKFALGKNGVYVEMLLVTQQPVNAENITVDVWRKDGSDYTNHVGDKKISTKSGVKLTNFHYSFFEPGEYKVSLFSEENTWICSGYLTVSR